MRNCTVDLFRPPAADPGFSLDDVVLNGATPVERMRREAEPFCDELT